MSVLVQHAPKPARPLRAHLAPPSRQVQRTVGLVLLPMFVLIAAPGTWEALTGLAAVLVGVVLARRRRRAKAWERELERAFRVSERKELSLRRVL